MFNLSQQHLIWNKLWRTNDVTIKLMTHKWWVIDLYRLIKVEIIIGNDLCANNDSGTCHMTAPVTVTVSRHVTICDIWYGSYFKTIWSLNWIWESVKKLRKASSVNFNRISEGRNTITLYNQSKYGVSSEWHAERVEVRASFLLSVFRS